MSRKAGKRQYELSALVKSQLDSLPTLGSPEFWERVSIREKKNVNCLAPEVLVITLRCFLLEGDIPSAKRLGEELIIYRWGRFIASQAWDRFPASESDRSDMRQEVNKSLWKEIFDHMESFWEANFIHALRTLCYDVAKNMEKHRDHEVPLPAAVDDEGEPIEEPPDIPDPKSQNFDLVGSQVEQTERLNRALATLPPRIRRVVYLTHILKWKASSANSAEMTVSKALGISSRTVRAELREGEAALRDFYTKETANERA